jgi:hypothetical protein
VGARYSLDEVIAQIRNHELLQVTFDSSQLEGTYFTQAYHDLFPYPLDSEATAADLQQRIHAFVAFASEAVGMETHVVKGSEGPQFT